jgi:hypothetical protein
MAIDSEPKKLKFARWQAEASGIRLTADLLLWLRNHPELNAEVLPEESSNGVFVVAVTQGDPQVIVNFLTSYPGVVLDDGVHYPYTSGN